MFEKSGMTWSQQAYLKASHAVSSQYFGQNVVVDGDTIVVAAAGDPSGIGGIDPVGHDSLAPTSGALYVYTRSGNAWSQQAFLKSSDPDSGDRLAWSWSALVFQGDQIYAGAYQEDGAGTWVDGDPSSNASANSGAVCGFRRTGGTWAQNAYFKAPNADADDQFGFSLAYDGANLLVSSVNERSNAVGIDGDMTDNSSLFRGAVYPFDVTP